MYLQNKYTRWYYQIISRAQLRKVSINRRLSNMFAFTCPHCSKIGKGKSNYLRWHGDNCKKKDL